jgi:Fe-S-cluster-containing hydrogenase component 2
MKTTIYIYSGTGNSLWVARQLAAEIGGAEVVPMISGKVEKAQAVGFVFPVHMWGIPGRVLEFINKLEKPPDTYYFAAAVNAGEVSRTLIQLKEVLGKSGVKLSAGISVAMPSNYVPWGGPGTPEELKTIFAGAEKAVSEAAAYIKSGSSGRVDMGPLWQRIIYTMIYKSSIKWVHQMDKDFWVDNKCNSCAICEKVCPAKNINLASGKPIWNHKCHQCLACIQWCPAAAIQFGKKTPQYPRYHHPSIKVNDMINIAKVNPE